MSLRFMVSAFQARVGHPGKKLVLLKLADFSNDEGICWPSRRRLAEDTELSESSIKRYLADLEKEGWIKAERRVQDGVNLPTIFHLVGLLPLVQGVGSHRPHPVHTDLGVGSGRPQGWGQGDPLTSHIPISEPQQQHAHTRARAREETPALPGGGAAAAPSNTSPPSHTPAHGGQQGKARRRRQSGVVTWNDNDIQEAERIEQQHPHEDIHEAVKCLEKQCLEPVPGRVMMELERLARVRQAARRQEHIMTMASQPDFDPRAKAKGDVLLSMIRARKQQEKELYNEESL